MEPPDTGPGAALEETREAELGDLAPHSHLSLPTLPSRAVCCLVASRWAASPGWVWGLASLVD